MSWERVAAPGLLARWLNHPGREIGLEHLSQVANKH